MQVRTSWVGLIDEWAGRFFHELKYESEARNSNSIIFKEQMAHLDGIVVPGVYLQLSNKQVFTTVWYKVSSCIRLLCCGSVGMLAFQQTCRNLVCVVIAACPTLCSASNGMLGVTAVLNSCPEFSQCSKRF